MVSYSDVKMILGVKIKAEREETSVPGVGLSQTV